MATSRKRNTRKGKQQQQQKPGKRKTSPMAVSRFGGGLDEPAKAWARLLSDPCNAPLVHPCYGQGETGILTRFNSELTYFGGATEVGGNLVFCPGAIGGGSGNTGGVVYSTPVMTNDAVAVAGWSNYTIQQPGYAFLSANASACRPVAACAQIFYIGNENTRQGFVSTGQVSGGITTSGNATGPTYAQFRQLASSFSRLPADGLEIKWKPAAGDSEFESAATNTDKAVMTRKGAVLIAAGKMPAATGIFVRLTVVYEWLPNSMLGVSGGNTGFNTSRFNVSQVVEAVQKIGAFSMHATQAALGIIHTGATMLG